jgi:hypothetical protein
MPPETTRRAVLTTAVWSTPVLAATVALPLAAASGPPSGFSVSSASAQVPAGASSTVTVTFPASALPIAPETVRLEYRLVSGTGVVVGGGLPPTWTYVWPSGTVIDFLPPASPSLTDNVFTLMFSGAGVWSITLRTPAGDFATQLEVIAPG